MLAANFDALNVGGVPISGGGASFASLIRAPAPGGNTYWVGNRSDLPSGDGYSAANPCASLGGANGIFARMAARVNRGDVVYVLPGHAENVNAADWAALMTTSSGFSIVGLGIGIERPQLTWTISTATFLLDTDAVQLANLRMWLAGPSGTGSLTVAAPITVSGNGCSMIGNEFNWGFDAGSIVGTGIICTGTDFKFIGNKALCDVAAVPTETFLRLNAADRAVIAYNDIRGATAGTTVGVIKGLTNASVDLDVRRNFLQNKIANSTIAFSPLASSTGVFAYNEFSVEVGILPITASIGRWHENYCCDTAGLASALVGSASS